MDFLELCGISKIIKNYNIMKKNLFFISILLLFCACDKLINDDFIIVNMCSDKIIINTTTFSGRTDVFEIHPNRYTLFLATDGIPRPKTSEMIKTLFVRIDITKNETKLII
jgi:hypothetical protein